MSASESSLPPLKAAPVAEPERRATRARGGGINSKLVTPNDDALEIERRTTRARGGGVNSKLLPGGGGGGAAGAALTAAALGGDDESLSDGSFGVGASAAEVAARERARAVAGGGIGPGVPSNHEHHSALMNVKAAAVLDLPRRIRNAELEVVRLRAEYSVTLRHLVKFERMLWRFVEV